MSEETNRKNLTTLVEDIYDLFDPAKGHEPCEENLDWIADELKNILRTRLAEREEQRDPLRFSALGKKDRQIWYASREDIKGEEMTAKTYFKFLYGDVIELLVLFLAKEAGHTVEDLQREVEIDGVKGHIDAIIDGTVVDVKSASPFGYKKFQYNDIVGNDPFGYVQQLAGYSSILNPGEAAAWVAFNKVHGDICVTPLSHSIIADHDPKTRIDHLREVIASETPPERCYDDIPDGQSGNRKLGIECSYCAYKNDCWPGLRKFLYANGPRYLTKTVNVPKVPEVPIEVQE